MPDRDKTQEKQIAELKKMLAENERLTQQMRLIISDLEAKTQKSKDKKRNN